MCELFGYSCRQESGAASSLQRFAEHSDRNPHGWGLAYYTGSGAVLKKKAIEARKSAEYYDAIKLARSKIIISHIRHASCGKINDANCHPFVQTFEGADWVFAHNGHVEGVGRHPMNAGETDSESAFHILMESVRNCRHMDNGTAYHGIASGIAGLFEEYEFGRQVGLNFVMSDGRVLYAFNHHPEKPMYYSSSGDAITVSTQKLGGGIWEPLPPDRLMLVKDGDVYRLSGRI
jgi:predicted glutamine amidotransferase